YLNLPLIQISDITGAYGVSFLVMLVNASLWKRKFFFAVACLILVFGYGIFRLNHKIDGEKIGITVIQGNVPQELKWVREEKEKILEKYTGLTRQAVVDKADLLIWPETAMPVVLEEEPGIFKAVSSLAKKINKPILTGVVRSENKNYFNSAVLFSPDGELIQHYDKIHLVPFGEYIPLRQPFIFLERLAPIEDFRRGKDYILFQIRNPKSEIRKKFGVLICFEDIFPELARRFVQRGADFLVNITNDAWFGKTSAAYQHLQSSVFRAIENRVSVVRSANTGVSGFISAQGKIISLVRDEKGRNIYVSGYDTEEIIIPAKKKLTFYTRFGDVFVLFCLMVFTYGIIIRHKMQSEKRKT
ncbi:MAG: apolipoprotein N-acyltransferase, partial [Candidatus Omnitrophica bacterium]|nr:apolipoprotein N-acyltransferase [Candidatus Omnitrophota bacterium]